MKRSALLKKLNKYYESVAGKYRLKVVYLYGSWAAQVQRKDSDVDIGVLFDDSVDTDGEKFNIISNMTLDTLTVS